MASKKLQKIVEKFVADVVAVAEEEALENIQEQLGLALTGKVTKVKRRKSPSHKGKSILKPCPIDGCKNTAAPRYQMVCKKHSDLPREKILLARDKAEKPGGIWYEIKHGKKKKTG